MPDSAGAKGSFAPARLAARASRGASERIAARITPACGTEGAKIFDISGNNLPVTGPQLIRVCQVLHLIDGPVEPAAFKLSLLVTILEILQVLHGFAEVIALVAIGEAARRYSAQIIQRVAYG